MPMGKAWDIFRTEKLVEFGSNSKAPSQESGTLDDLQVVQVSHLRRR